MSPQQFCDLGRALWGNDGWRPRAADFLAVKGRTLHAWADGAQDIPEGVASELIGEGRRRRELLNDLLF